MLLPTVVMPQPIAKILPPTAIPFLTTVAVANPQQPPRQVAQNAPTALSAVVVEAADRNALWAEVEDRQQTTEEAKPVNGQQTTDNGLCLSIVTALTVQRSPFNLYSARSRSPLTVNHLRAFNFNF